MPSGSQTLSKTSLKVHYIETSINFNLNRYIFLHTLAPGTLLFCSPMILLRSLLLASLFPFESCEKKNANICCQATGKMIEKN